MFIQLVFIYAVCARAMVLLTYWAARMFGWTESRFAGVDAPSEKSATGFVISVQLQEYGIAVYGTCGSSSLRLQAKEASDYVQVTMGR